MKKKPWWIYVLIVFISAAVVIWGAEQYLKKKIRQELQIQTVRGDTLQVNQVNLGLIGGWVDINDLLIRWNIGGEDGAKERLTYVMRGEVGKVQIKGLSFLQYILRGKIQIRQLLIDSSQLDLFLIRKAPLDTDAEPDSDQAASLTVDIAGIALAPSRIRYFESRDLPPSLEVGGLGLDIQGFRYPQDSLDRNFLQEGNFTAQDVRFGRPDYFSDLFLHRLVGSVTDSSLHFRQLHFLPRFSKEEYSRHLKNQDSRVDITVAEGRLQGINWRGLLNAGDLQVRTFEMDSCNIQVYEDSRLPIDETRYKSLYQEKLLKLDLAITLDSLLVRNGNLNYEIRPKEAVADLGYLDFRSLQATITNITNDSQRITYQPLLKASIQTVLNGESRLNTYFTFDLSSDQYAYTYSGEMHGFDLSRFNTMLSETSKMSITEGIMQQMKFEVEADNQVARGEMHMDYSDLKIEWLDKHNRLAALAQKIVMRESNPRNGNYRIGQIYFERLPSRSFWNYYVKSLLSGLNSIAMPNLLLPEELDSRKEKD
jgi:hypothetical protein